LQDPSQFGSKEGFVLLIFGCQTIDWWFWIVNLL